MAASPAHRLKELAAARALELVTDNMLVGLGTGSTTAHFIQGLGRLIGQQKLRVSGVPTSNDAAELAQKAGVPLVELDPARKLDLTVDGADEVDPALNLIKGLGGALLREKIVAAHSRLHVTVVEDSKLVPRLATKGPLPVEVAPFGHRVTAAQLEGLGCRAELRTAPDGEPFVTDNGNFIYHTTWPAGLAKPAATEAALLALPGLVQTGLFIGLTHRVIVAGGGGLKERVGPGASAMAAEGARP